jgi:hypothetical protein
VDPDVVDPDVVDPDKDTDEHLAVGDFDPDGYRTLGEEALTEDQPAVQGPPDPQAQQD